MSHRGRLTIRWRARQFEVLNGSMSTLWFGAISSLGGVLIGAWTTYLIQKANWKRETRRQVYANFAGESRIWLESIQRVKSAIEWNFEPFKREPHWDRA